MRLAILTPHGSGRMMYTNRFSLPVFWATILVSKLSICQASERLTVDSLQGVYKESFQNAMMDGTQYTSENRFLLMSVSPVTAYFDLHLEWANGHNCALSGIADVTSPQIMTYSTPSILEKTCTFNINLGTQEFSFSDSNGACRLISCGARGLLDGVEFEYEIVEKIVPSKVKKTSDFMRVMSEYKSEDTAKSE